MHLQTTLAVIKNFDSFLNEDEATNCLEYENDDACQNMLRVASHFHG